MDIKKVFDRINEKPSQLVNINDLRIGNYVEYNGIICVIYSIISPEPRKDPKFDNKCIIDLFDGGGLITTTLDDIKSVLISNDKEKSILPKLGFKYVESDAPGIGEYGWWENEHFSLTRTFGEYIHGIEGTTIPPFDSLHKLQNIHYILIGKELNFI